MNDKLLFGREKMGLNQEEFGKLFCPIRTAKTVSGWEKNHDSIPLEVILMYANISNDSLDYLFEISKDAIKYSKFEIDKVRLGQKLKEERLKKNLSQKEIADLLNTTQSVVSRWENGKTLISIDFFIDFINHFEGLSIDELFDRVKLENKK